MGPVLFPGKRNVLIVMGAVAVIIAVSVAARSGFFAAVVNPASPGLGTFNQEIGGTPGRCGAPLSNTNGTTGADFCLTECKYCTEMEVQTGVFGFPPKPMRQWRFRCDEGNGQACNPLNPPCGNWKADPGEQCDDGNTSPFDSCTATCQNARCGDGIMRYGTEQCETTRQQCVTGRRCANDCRCLPVNMAFCGNGRRDGMEQCDDANITVTDSCINCLPARCGDRAVHTGVEQCDDGNTLSGDGCSATCMRETGQSSPSSTASPLPSSANSAPISSSSRSSTPAAACGNGLCEAGEGIVCPACAVDPQGNPVGECRCAVGTCPADCLAPPRSSSAASSAAAPRCGDNHADPGEQCDDGNQATNDSCVNCRSAICGNGTVWVNSGVQCAAP